MFGKYSSLVNTKAYSGTMDNSYDFTTDTSLNWRIWSIDENKLVLISDVPTNVGGYKNIGGLNLASCNGYNNGVKILNDICKECYSQSDYGASARSLNIDDIDGVLNLAEWNPKKYVSKKTDAVAYSSRKEYTANIAYPYIYSLERFSNIDNAEISELDGIQKSEQSILYSEKETFLKANEIINPLQTAWANSDWSKANFVHENYYYMIFKEKFQSIDTLRSYFLASRSIDLAENHVNFGIFEVSMGNSIQTNPLYNSRGGSLEYWDRIRPVVEIPMENIEIDKTSDGMSHENAWKIKVKNL